MIDLKIYESPSGTFIVKSGSEILAGFYKKEHAEIFVNALCQK
jgi:hypothetical protein